MHRPPLRRRARGLGGRRLAARLGQVWNLVTVGLIGVFVGLTGDGLSFLPSFPFHLCHGSLDNKVMIWAVAEGVAQRKRVLNPVHTLDGHEGCVNL